MEKETKLKPGAVLVMQNDSQVWRRCRVIEGAGLMSKKVKIHYIGYQTKWDGKRNCYYLPAPGRDSASGQRQVRTGARLIASDVLTYSLASLPTESQQSLPFRTRTLT